MKRKSFLKTIGAAVGALFIENPANALVKVEQNFILLGEQTIKEQIAILFANYPKHGKLLISIIGNEALLNLRGYSIMNVLCLTKNRKEYYMAKDIGYLIMIILRETEEFKNDSFSIMFAKRIETSISKKVNDIDYNRYIKHLLKEIEEFANIKNSVS